jgi:hypothetical protein
MVVDMNRPSIIVGAAAILNTLFPLVSSAQEPPPTAIEEKAPSELRRELTPSVVALDIANKILAGDRNIRTYILNSDGKIDSEKRHNMQMYLGIMIERIHSPELQIIAEDYAPYLEMVRPQGESRSGIEYDMYMMSLSKILECVADATLPASSLRRSFQGVPKSSELTHTFFHNLMLSAKPPSGLGWHSYLAETLETRELALIHYALTSIYLSESYQDVGSPYNSSKLILEGIYPKPGEADKVIETFKKFVVDDTMHTLQLAAEAAGLKGASIRDILKEIPNISGDLIENLRPTVIPSSEIPRRMAEKFLADVKKYFPDIDVDAAKQDIRDRYEDKLRKAAKALDDPSHPATQLVIARYSSVAIAKQEITDILAKLKKNGYVIDGDNSNITHDLGRDTVITAREIRAEQRRLSLPETGKFDLATIIGLSAEKNQFSDLMTTLRDYDNPDIGTLRNKSIFRLILGDAAMDEAVTTARMANKLLGTASEIGR